MLFAGWEVRIVKNCDRGLENAARGRRPRAAFSSPRSQFFTIRTDPISRQITYLFFSCANLAYNWVYTTLLLNWFTCRLQTIVKNLTNERASKLRHYPKKDVLTDLFWIAFMLVASNSPVKCFSDSEISRSLTEVALQAQSLSVVANHSKSDLFTVNWVAESEEIR